MHSSPPPAAAARPDGGLVVTHLRRRLRPPPACIHHPPQAQPRGLTAAWSSPTSAGVFAHPLHAFITHPTPSLRGQGECVEWSVLWSVLCKCPTGRSPTSYRSFARTGDSFAHPLPRAIAA